MSSSFDDSLSDDRVRELAALDEQLRAGREPASNVADDYQLLARLARNWAPPGQDGPRPRPSIGPYEVEREIGRGGFGVVFFAKETATGQHVALKVPRPELFLSEAIRRRFLTEASAIAALSHPNIIQVYDVGYAGPVCYIASAYCEGSSLAEELLTRRQRFAPRQAAHLVMQLASAAHYVHRSGLLHRDLKPSNVLLWPATETETTEGMLFIPKLTDFGLAKFVEQSLEDTRSSVLLGTPLYMAPEQAECRHEDVGPWTDVYALGAILYELLSGAPPFAGQGLLLVLNRVRHEAPRPLSSIDRTLPADLSRICLKCLAKEPFDRYASADELEAELKAYLEGRPVRAAGPPLSRRVRKFCRQPERMRDAGLWMILLNVGMMLWLFGNMVAVGLHDAWRAELPGHYEPAAVLLALSTHLPLSIFGWFTLRRRWWAIYCGMAGAILLLGMAMIPLFGPLGPFTGMYPNEMSLWNVFFFLTILFSVQAALQAMALIARRSWRE